MPGVSHTGHCPGHRLVMEPLTLPDASEPARGIARFPLIDTVGSSSRTTDEHAPVALWNIETLAQRLSVSPRFVRRLVAERRIPYLKVGAYVRFDPDDVRQWLDTKRVPWRR